MKVRTDYADRWCFQYKKRLDHNPEDLKTCPFPRHQWVQDEFGLWQVHLPVISDEFTFAHVPPEDAAQCAEIARFTETYEWLASMPQQATHRFVARTRRSNILAGVVIMSLPTTFSKLLGADTPKLERLISRGASISWAPKNLASWLITRSIGWMAHHTQFRLFIGYSDPEAKELGTVYQACNFMYLGQDYGARVLLCDPDRPDEWFSDRHLRHITACQKYAAEAGIAWKDEWVERQTIRWERIPPGFAAILKRKEDEYRSRCIERTAASKGKYAYIKARTKQETKRLRRLFAELNPELVNLPYPKEGGEGEVAPRAGTVVPPTLERPAGVLLSEVTAEEVTWLWAQRIPRAKLTLLEGDPDEGKSTVAFDLAARVSTGAAMPLDTTMTKPAGVVILSAEDALGDTIRPRLEAAGADLDRILGFRFEELPTIPEGLTVIEAAINRVEAALVIIDPLVAFFSRAVHAYRDHDVRRALTPLMALAERTGAAVLAVRHLNKARTARAKYRGSGSIGIMGAARSALLVARDPEDANRRLLAPVKGNLAVPASAVAFSLVSAGTTARIAWLGETSHTAETLLAQAAPELDRAALTDAVEFLQAALADGERPATDVLSEGTALGIAERTLRRARKALGVLVRRQGFKDGRFLLALPPNGSDAADGATQPKSNGNGLDHDHAALSAPSGFSVS
jgi:hypothetical protein